MYCVRQVVKTPTIISNDPVHCTFCIVYYENSKFSLNSTLQQL